MVWVALAIFALGLIHFTLKYPEFKRFMAKLGKVVGAFVLLLVLGGGIYWAYSEWEEAKVERQRIEAQAQKEEARRIAAAQKEKAERLENEAIRQFFGGVKAIPLTRNDGRVAVPEQGLEWKDVKVGDIKVDGWWEKGVTGRASNRSASQITSFTIHVQVYDCPSPVTRDPRCADVSQLSLRWTKSGCSKPLITRDQCDKLAEESVEVLVEIPNGQTRDFSAEMKSNLDRRKHEFRGDVFKISDVWGVPSYELPLRSMAQDKGVGTLPILRTLVAAEICNLEQTADMSWTRLEEYSLTNIYYTDACGARVFLDNRRPQKLYMKK